MAILSEDVIIRLLVDTNKGVADLKKAEGQTTSFAKSALKMAAAMGGAALAFELVVKAITSYINYVKEAEKAAVKFAKESGKALDSSVMAYDRLNAAKEESKRIDGEAHLAYMEGHRERRAARVEETNLVKAMTDAQMASWSAANLGKARWNEDFESRVEFMQRIIAEQNAYNDQLSATRARVAENAEANRLLNEAELQAIRDRDAAAAQSEADRLAAIATRQEAERTAMQERQDAINAEYALQGQIITAIHDMRSEANAADLALIESKKQAEISAALTVAGVLTSLLGTAFGDSKAAAIAVAGINTALAIMRLYVDLPIWAAIAATPLVLGTMAAQVSNINQQSYATGTPPGGYVVPPGYENDSFPVSAASGETVTVSRPGQDSGQMVYNVINIDGYQFGEIITRLTKSGKATVASRAVVA